MKKFLSLLAFGFVILTCQLVASGPAYAKCTVAQANPCGPNNPITEHVRVVWYEVAEVVLCPDGSRYIVASNGRQWHNPKWNWSRIRVGSRFRIADVHRDSSGVLHGTVVWEDEG